MTRKEQIEKAAQDKYNDYNVFLNHGPIKAAFLSGAEWADTNPVDKEKLDDVRRVLNRLAILQSGSMDYTIDFYERVKTEIRELLRRIG